MINEGHGSVETPGRSDFHLCSAQTGRFSIVKFRSEGEVAWLTLDRPEHNLLNEGCWPSSRRDLLPGRPKRDQAIVIDSAAKGFLRRYRAWRVYAAARVPVARCVSWGLLRYARYFQARSGCCERTGIWGRCRTCGSRRSGDRDTEGSICPTGNQAWRFSASRRRYSSLHRRTELALELVLTGETMTAERARDLGLVNWVVPQDELDQSERSDWKVTAQSGPVLTMAKKAILAAWDCRCAMASAIP